MKLGWILSKRNWATMLNEMLSRHDIRDGDCIAVHSKGALAFVVERLRREGLSCEVVLIESEDEDVDG